MSVTVGNIVLGWIIGTLIYGTLRQDYDKMLHTGITGTGAILMTAAVLGAFK